MISLIDCLSHEHHLDADDYIKLIQACDKDDVFSYLRDKATQTARKRFGFGIYTRGLIEISNYCKNNCLYCGLRRDNKIKRYRLSCDEILECCKSGYDAGLRTFVLQGGEDTFFTDERLINLIRQIRQNCQDAAITLSLGERPATSYRQLYNAGASRYLLRHEAADKKLYKQIHTSEMSFEHRIDCITHLLEIGYQTGMGMMVGVPGQTVNHLVEDLMLMTKLRPQMIGIGAFIPHIGTPLGHHSAGNMRLTLSIVAICRLMFPDALIPATTALATLSPTGFLDGILSGANVVMPNISPLASRAMYEIYNNKHDYGVDTVESLNILQKQLAAIGYCINPTRGDYLDRADQHITTPQNISEL